MHRKLASLFFGVLLITGTAFADQPSVRLTRTSETGMQLSANLSKDITRTESYEDSYTVQVPYQDTETYYEDVPYTETVPYTDYEEYYESEHRCRTVYDNERQCHQERVCRRTGGDQICETVTECGTNAHGAPICKDRRVCRQGPDREDCDYVQRCENVSRPRQECSWEQVRKTRPVTRYREETRYRRETRTREVTRYRTETRCCVTRYREVYDRTWSLPTKVVFPAGSELVAGEKETFVIEMAGTESAPDVVLNGTDTVFGYKVARKDIKPGSALIELALVPKYKAEDLGVSKIKDLKLSVSKAGEGKLSFKDLARVARVSSSYSVIVVDKDTQAVVAQAAVNAAAAQDVTIALPGVLGTDRDLVANLKVLRQGAVIENGRAEFVAQTEFLFDRIPMEQVGQKSVALAAYEESEGQIRLPFQDKGHSDLIVTKYEARLLDEAGQVIWSQSAGAEILDGQGKAKLSMEASLLAEDKVYQFILKVSREGRRLAAPVSFEVKSQVTRKLDIAAMKDGAKIVMPKIEGRGEKAMLVFADKSPVHPLVKTRYRISTARLNAFGQKTYLSEKTLERASIQVEADGTIKLSLADLGVSLQNLRSHFTAGKTVYLSVEVFRASPRFKEIALWKGGNVKVP